MEQTLTITEVRSRLLDLPEKLGKDKGNKSLTVTRHGKPVLAILDWELYESIIETLEVLGDSHLMKALRESIQQAEKGQTISWEKAKSDLGL